MTGRTLRSTWGLSEASPLFQCGLLQRHSLFISGPPNLAGGNAGAGWTHRGTIFFSGGSVAGDDA